MVIDTTGQVAPAGMKPRVTATLWEDEGTLCFQVDVCVDHLLMDSQCAHLFIHANSLVRSKELVSPGEKVGPMCTTT